VKEKGNMTESFSIQCQNDRTLTRGKLDEIGRECLSRGKRDVHSAVAAFMFSKPEGEVTKEDRQLAKMVSFQLIYSKT
jgi:hypothetical protein